jgi:hypothetical protein
VIYKFYSGGYEISDKMSLEDARIFKLKCLEMYYKEDEVYIIQIIE